MSFLLYVDDAPDLLGLGNLFLEKEGECQVATAGSATDGMAALSSQHIASIVSDYQMPDVDGLAFLKYVR